VRRDGRYVEIKVRGQQAENFDHAFIACHGDQALAMLADPTLQEQQVLGQFGFQSNDTVLHTDESVMPRRRRAWAAWNYHIPKRSQERVALTYNMNILQGIRAPAQFCVSLNHTEAIRPDKIIQRFQYRHPVFTSAAVAAQQRQADINGAKGTYFCGAYWRNGFHEDGVVSALEALKHFRDRLQNA
jgi:predicted NAD/FAD-binding protein